MPRYFITTFDGFQAHDDEGLVLPDAHALAKLLRQSLAGILLDASIRSGGDEFWAEAHDDNGQHVMTAKVVMTVVQLERH